MKPSRTTLASLASLSLLTTFAVTIKVGEVSLKGVFHDFTADSGSGDYGSEIDYSATYAWKPGLKVGAKYADFSADDAPFVDTAKT